jgi:hypothetical protein
MPDPIKKKTGGNKPGDKFKAQAAKMQAITNARNKDKAKKIGEQNKSRYQKSLDTYRNDYLTIGDDLRNAPKNLNPRSQEQAMRAVSNKRSRMDEFESNTFNHDAKNHPERVEGFDKKSYALNKATGGGSKVKVDNGAADKAKAAAAAAAKAAALAAANLKKDSNKTGKVNYSDAWAGRTKEYQNMSEATYTEEAKRQNASKKAGKGWDASGSSSVDNKTTKSGNFFAEMGKTLANDMGKTKDMFSSRIKTDNVFTKIGNDLTKSRAETKSMFSGGGEADSTSTNPSSKTNRKTKSINKKQAKADEARASGNTRKADRKERSISRKEDRMENRASTARSKGEAILADKSLSTGDKQKKAKAQRKIYDANKKL